MYAQDPLTDKLTPFVVNRSLPPQSIDAEESILGGIIIGGTEALNRVREIIEPDAFYVQAHRDIYKVFLKLDKQGIPIDLMTVTDFFRQGRNQKLESFKKVMISASCATNQYFHSL